MRRIYPFAAPLVLASLTQAAFGADWPQWRGPHLNGHSSEVDLPVHWSAQENVVWRTKLPGRGAATPIVSGGHIFLTVGHDPETSGQLELWCLSRDDGRVLWKRPLGAGNEFLYKQHLTSPSPVTDGSRVFVLTGTGIFKAFSFDGAELWSRDLQSDYGRFGLKWGYASSPLLWKEALYVQVLHGHSTDDPSYLLRLNPENGTTVWRSERTTDAVAESPDAYTTPTILESGSGEQLVVAGGDVLTGHDLATGKETWRVDGLNPKNDRSQRLVATPLVAGDTVFAFAKRGPTLAFRTGPDGAGRTLAWSIAEGTDVPTPVSDGEHLYIVNDKGIAWCIDTARGTVVWGPERLAVGTYSASLVLADGKIYATSEDGVTTVFAASDTFRPVAENDLEGYTLASPAISDGQIFLRTDDALYAIGDRRSEL